MNTLPNQQTQFQQLTREAARCVACPAMCERRAVLSELNGSLQPRVLFVAEAPGRQGGDRTRVPLNGDASGANFNRFINSINLARTDIFITNAVLCNPHKLSGANRTPSRAEITNCAVFLQRQLELLNAPVIATLGRVALEALKAVAYHDFTLQQHAGRILRWNKRLLVPLFHPSPQVLASHRREAAQLEDYQELRRALDLIS